MRIGVPAEIQAQEGRVGLVPGAVRALTRAGHTVLVQQGAGHASGLSDDEYLRAGAVVHSTPEEVWGGADLVWKVQAPAAPELSYLRKDLVLLAFLHLAVRPDLAELLRARGVTAIGYETVTDTEGRLPLLMPMSEVGGRMAVALGSLCLTRGYGGQGVLLGGVPGVDPGDVLILGAGTLGSTAAQVARNLGAMVTVLDLDPQRLRALHARTPGLRTLHADPWNLERALGGADLVIGAVLSPGARAPILLPRERLSLMRPGAVLMDLCIDQGGCAETSRITTHADPTYVVDGVVHCAIPNMPGAVPRTSTFALSAATLPYGLGLCALGAGAALSQAAGTSGGLQVAGGQIQHPAVAAALSK